MYGKVFLEVLLH